MEINGEYSPVTHVCVKLEMLLAFHSVYSVLIWLEVELWHWRFYTAAPLSSPVHNRNVMDHSQLEV